MSDFGFGTSEGYALTVGQISMTTQGGGIVHAKDAAYATEGITYYAEIRNDTAQYLGPFEVDFTVDNNSIAAWGGMSHEGVGAHQAVWVHGYTEHLAPGNHTLHVKVNASDNLFRGGEQSLAIEVLEPHSHRTMQQGAEAGHQGWAQRQVYVVLRDFTGAGFNSEAYLTFSGPGGEASERGQVVDGNLTLDNVWVPNDGNLVITVTTQQHEHPTIQGTTSFKSEGESVHLQFIQAKSTHTESWQDMEQFTDKVGVKGSAGVDFKIWKAGIDVTYEHSWGESHSHAQTYDIWTPTDQLDDLDKPSTRSR
jgi:hypothetical protein